MKKELEIVPVLNQEDASMMKSIISLLFVIFMVLCIASCAAAPEETPTEGPSEGEPTLEEPAEATPIEPEMYSILSPVVILVVDNFHVYDESEQLKLITSGNCLITPGGFGNYGAMDFGNYGAMDFGNYGAADEGSPLDHGRYVKEEVARLITSNGGQLKASTFDGDEINFNFEWLEGVELYRVEDDQYIILISFNTFNFNTAMLAGNLQEAINYFIESNEMSIGENTIEPVRRFVINMSFGIVPCDPGELVDTDEYAQAIAELSGIAEFRTLVESFMMSTGVSEDEAKKTVALTMIPGTIKMNISRAYPEDQDDPSKIEFLVNDPLNPTLENLFHLREDTTIISVAAAGNFGNSYAYPFAPAMWDNVISIGGEVSYGETATSSHVEKANYSNPGELLMSGKLVDYPNINEATSFAAPKFSYLAAIYLLNNGGKFCDPGGNSIYPPMGYAGDQGPWSNFSLARAATDYCTDFLEIQSSVVVEAFNEAHDDIELIQEVVPNESARDTLSAQFAAGDGPDIVGSVGVCRWNDLYGQWLDLSP